MPGKKCVAILLLRIANFLPPLVNKDNIPGELLSIKHVKVQIF